MIQLQIRDPFPAGAGIVTPEIAQIENTETGVFRFANHVRKVCQLTARKNALQQKAGLWIVVNILRTADPGVDKTAAGNEHTVDPSEVFAEPPAPDVFEHSD